MRRAGNARPCRAANGWSGSVTPDAFRNRYPMIRVRNMRLCANTDLPPEAEFTMQTGAIYPHVYTIIARIWLSIRGILYRTNRL